MASLDCLPLELLFMVFELLSGRQHREHPFLVLSRTCKPLYAAVDAYCLSRLHTLRNRLPHTSPKAPFVTRAFTARRRLLQHQWTHCAFCARKSQRKAIMDAELTCCKGCDADMWPGKITLADASKRYRVTKAQLEAAGLATGQYSVFNTCNTMFLEAEVRALAASLHTAGDTAALMPFLASKRPLLLDGREKLRLRERMRHLELHALLEANGVYTDEVYQQLQPKLHSAVSLRPRTILRSYLLEQRLCAETDYVARVARLEQMGYRKHSDQLFSPPDRWSTQLPKYTAGPLSTLPVRDPRDEALAALFVKQFGPLPPLDDLPSSSASPAPSEDDIPGISSVAYVHMWRRDADTGAPMLEAKSFLPNANWVDSRFPLWDDEFAINSGAPPWSWNLFPIFVKRAYFRDLIKERAGNFVDEEEERAEVGRINRERRAEFDRVCQWIRDVVRAGGLQTGSSATASVGLGLWRSYRCGFPVWNQKWNQRFFATGKRDEKELQRCERKWIAEHCSCPGSQDKDVKSPTAPPAAPAAVSLADCYQATVEKFHSRVTGGLSFLAATRPLSLNSSSRSA